MSELRASTLSWPFHRERPTRVVLDVRPGIEPSGLPPVRIFLGTEEAQYRAERIFFHSVERVRDPSRVYEIHLMKNVLGFDRSRWRTGFTNYRYAIPEWAGGSGRAIYNDVDQIYLADPALLFDHAMGNHGYLAISAKDTSVMLIDCGRMIDLWNIEAAATLGKHALIDKPSATPGLWGELDGHWNARDQEYVEGRTKCLHYTALHQQPWEPFPEVYSYHPNPLAYVWHDLEREADRLGYEVFTSAAPSPDFGPALVRPLSEGEAPPAPGEVPTALAKALDLNDGLLVGWPGRAGAAPFATELLDRRLELGSAALAGWPEQAADAVIASDVLPHLPPADLPWLLHALFRAARKLVHVDAVATAREGLGSAEWWRKRLDEISARHPGKSWSLTVADKAAPIPGTIRHFAVRSRPLPEPGTVWAVLDGVPARDAQVRALADATGFAVVEKPLSGGVFSGGIMPHGSLEGPLPDVVVACGKQAGAVARSIKVLSRGAARTVQLEAAGAFDRFDLVVANPAERLPIRPNTVEITAPLAAPDDASAPADGPALAILTPVARPFKRTPAAAAALGRALAAGAPAEKAILVLGGIEEGVLEAVRDAAGGAAVLDATTPLDAAITGAGRLVTHGEDPALLARLCASGKPVELVPLPCWYDSIPGSRPVRNLLTLLIGGGTSYRGTPHQQHALGRLIDRLIAAGWLRLPGDPARLHRALISRGLLRPAGAGEAMASPHPLDDRELVVEAIRRVLTRQALAG